ncbi:MAG: hypothetical protein FWC47_02635 [Oscillospiraceae bacterium]|nr:hypothetical protein [Oscillospiraceae bacterium]
MTYHINLILRGKFKIKKFLKSLVTICMCFSLLIGATVNVFADESTNNFEFVTISNNGNIEKVVKYTAEEILLVPEIVNTISIMPAYFTNIYDGYVNSDLYGAFVQYRLTANIYSINGSYWMFESITSVNVSNSNPNMSYQGYRVDIWSDQYTRIAYRFYNYLTKLYEEYFISYSLI